MNYNFNDRSPDSSRTIYRPNNERCQQFLFNNLSSSSNSYDNGQFFTTMTTDVGICVDMKNVNLNCPNPMATKQYPSNKISNNNSPLGIPPFLSETNSSSAIFMPETNYFVPNAVATSAVNPKHSFLYALSPSNVKITQEHDDYYVATAIVPKYGPNKAVSYRPHNLCPPNNFPYKPLVPSSTTTLYTTVNLNNKNLVNDHKINNVASSKSQALSPVNTTRNNFEQLPRKSPSNKTKATFSYDGKQQDNAPRYRTTLQPKLTTDYAIQTGRVIAKPSLGAMRRTVAKVETVGQVPTVDLFADNNANLLGEVTKPKAIQLAVPKKKWLHRHYYNDEPRVNGNINSTAPPLVVISPSQHTTSVATNHALHNTPPLTTIDLSMARNNSTIITTSATLFSNSGNTTSLASIPIAQQQLLHQQIINSHQDDQLNLSTGTSSGYMSNNSSFNVSASPVATGAANMNTSNSSSLNLSCTNITNSPLPPTTIQQPINGLMSIAAVDHLNLQQLQPQPAATTNRRRTTSTNSNGAGTREVHNKLEKNRRAHLKECFETLKKQLPAMPEEKKTSNLSILGAAIRHIHVLKRKERELEYEMERLAKEKITAQNRILFLKRELTSFDIDCTKLTPEAGGSDLHTVKQERDQMNEPPLLLASDRNGMRYSSSSSLSSVATVASTNSTNNNSSNNSNNLTQQQLQTINNLSPVILQQQHQPTLKSSPHHITQSLYLSGNGTNTVSLPNSSNLSNISTVNTTMMFPLSLTTTPAKMTSANVERGSPSNQDAGPMAPLKFTPNGLTSSASNQSISYFTTSASGSHPLTNGLSAFSLRTANETLISSNGQAVPLNLNASSAGTMLSQSGFQMINSKDLNLVAAAAAAAAGKNGIRTAGIAHDLHELAPNAAAAFMINKAGKEGKIELINTSMSDTNNVISSTAITSTTLPNINASSSKLMDHEPPTKFIKLINGIALNAGLEASSHQKEVAPNGKGLHSGQLTLQQVGNGNLILNPIQLLTPQSLRVIQSNGLATIELSPNVAQQNHHRTNPHNHQLITTPMTTSVSGPQLHKLLVSGTTTTANGSASHAGNGGGVVFTSELARLPGGAELNILPAGTNGATIYRGGNGLAILNNGGIGFKGAADSTTSRQVHISNSHNVVSRGGSTTTTNLAQILAAAQSSATTQQGSKVINTPLSMVVAVATSGNNNKSTPNNLSFNHLYNQHANYAVNSVNSAVPINSVVVSSSSSKDLR